VTIGALYFGRVVFIPLSLALLLALLLTPPVAFLEKIKLPRTIAIFAVVFALIGLMGVIAWRTSQQFVDLTNQMPAYKEALKTKIQTIKGSGGQSFNNASDTMKELESEIVTATPGSRPTEGPKKTVPPLGSSPGRPLTVQVMPPANPLESFETMFGPLATAGVVAIFTIFILFGREDLRNRLIRLAGAGQLNLMTKAMDEASHRINKYLLLQFFVNSAYGLLIGVALHFIGVPNAALWGLGAATLRFLPYIGPPLAALMPILLSLAIFPGWYHALATAGLFVALELIVSNVVEPLLYGAHLGISPLAILIAAVFWTLVWGLPGLVLSTPLTVCLLVIGRYVPRLNFLNVILGDEPVLSPQSQYYQRLLAADQNEARQILELYVKEKSLDEACSDVVIPAMSLAEQDRHRHELDEETENFIYQSTREILGDLDSSVEVEANDSPATTSTIGSQRQSGIDVLCIPARDQADDVLALMLSQVLSRRGHRALSLPIGSISDMLSAAEDLNPGIICISALPPFALAHARALYAKVRYRMPQIHIVVCMWHFDGDVREASARLKLAEEHGLFTTLAEISKHIDFRRSSVGSESSHSPREVVA
jgi:predicted PurR-regulated permease PerM